jgi:hypothetical protein
MPPTCRVHPDPGDRHRRPALLCATIARKPRRGDRMPLREAAPLVAAMSLTLWSAIGTLVWTMLR